MRNSLKIILTIFSIFTVISCSEENSDSNEKTISLLAFLSQSQNRSSEEAPGEGVNEDLEKPAENKATLKFQDFELTLDRGANDCQNGGVGVGYERASTTLGEPITLFVHNISATQAIGDINFSNNGGNFQVDIDIQGGGAFQVVTGGNCQGKLIENSATHIDIQAKDCDFQPQGGGTTFKISFRAFCRKN